MRFGNFTSVCAALVAFLHGVAGAQIVGEPFPDFSATDAVSGQKISLSDHRGRVVLIDFWATWCGPCRQELPGVRNVFREYQDKGLEIISISLDSDPAKFKSFVKNNGMNWHHVMEGGGWGTRLAKQFGVTSIPKMYLIDPDGKCVSSSLRGDRLAKAVEREIKNVKPGAIKSSASISSKGPSLITKLTGELLDLKLQLDAAAAPLGDLSRRLQAAKETSTKLGRQAAGLMSDADREFVAAWRRELLDLRRDVFLADLLNGRRAMMSRDAASADAMALAMLAIETMNHAVVATKAASDELGRELTSLQKRLNEEPITLDAVQSQFAAAAGKAREAIANRNHAWSNQLLGLSETLARRAEADAIICDRIAAAQRQVEGLQSQLRQNPAGRRMMTRLRDDFTSLRAELVDLAPIIDGIDARSVTMPEDVFETASPGDPPLASVEAQTAVAEKIIAQFQQRAAVLKAASTKCAGQFAQRIKHLQDQAQATDSHAANTDELHAKYSALCAEILLAWD